MDPDFSGDLDRLRDLIEEAEVVTIFFPLIGKTLVADLRNDPEDGPSVSLMPMVRTVDERIKLLERQRPRLGPPEAVVALPWFMHARALRESGIVDWLERRLSSLGSQSALDCLQLALDQLFAAEAEHTRNLIRGHGYRTIWQRSRS